MAKAKKLASGNYRALVYDYTDENGKRHYESFTAKTKKDAELMAAQYAAQKDDRKRPDNITVSEAVERYIQVKYGVISPTTVRTYKSNLRTHFDGIGHYSIRKVTNPLIQLWISELSARGLAPKTVRNTYGLFSATMSMFRPDFIIDIKLPQKKKTKFYTPSDNNISVLLNQIAGTELEIAVLLAAFGPLRRSEICAIKDTDIDFATNTIYVCQGIVRDEHNNWILKDPKNEFSTRPVVFPPFVIQKMAGIEGYIIKAHPDAISERFRRALRISGLPKFRLHDLRHYAASILHAIGVPDEYIIQRGGWATDYVMKTVYRDTISDEEIRQTQKILAHFTNVANASSCTK